MAEADENVTVIGRGARLEGDFTINGSMRIDGHFKGRIAADGAVTLSAGSEVQADILGADVVIAGILRGNVVASNRAAVAASGRVEGDVTSGALVVAEGGVFNGRSIMDGGPARQG